MVAENGSISTTAASTSGHSAIMPKVLMSERAASQTLAAFYYICGWFSSSQNNMLLSNLSLLSNHSLPTFYSSFIIGL